jgi:ABC-type multidrug transport system ATPase subunit
MNEVVRVAHLSKRFKEIHAVDDLSFSVRQGEVYGFLGQNGAGKSTTIRMLLTLIAPTGGSIQLFGRDVHRHRKEVLSQTGAVIEKPDLYKYLSALDNLRIMARMSGASLSTAQLMQRLEQVGLQDRAGSRVKTFSQGMKQRLGIACALVNNPKLVILDEPTNGLDPQGIADMRNLILHLSKNEGRTLIVSSHLLSEMELIADSMIIIDKGRKVVEGSMSELLNPAHTKVLVRAVNEEQARAVLLQSQWASLLQPQSDELVLMMHSKEVPLLAKFLVDQQVALLSLSPRHSLEDYFLSLTTPNQHVAAYTH